MTFRFEVNERKLTRLRNLLYGQFDIKKLGDLVFRERPLEGETWDCVLITQWDDSDPHDFWMAQLMQNNVFIISHDIAVELLRYKKINNL